MWTLIGYYNSSLHAIVSCYLYARSRATDAVQVMDEAKDSVPSLQLSRHEILTGYVTIFCVDSCNMLYCDCSVWCDNVTVVLEYCYIIVCFIRIVWWLAVRTILFAGVASLDLLSSFIKELASVVCKICSRD